MKYRYGVNCSRLGQALAGAVELRVLRISRCHVQLAQMVPCTWLSTRRRCGPAQSAVAYTVPPNGIVPFTVSHCSETCKSSLIRFPVAVQLFSSASLLEQLLGCPLDADGSVRGYAALRDRLNAQHCG